MDNPWLEMENLSESDDMVLKIDEPFVSAYNAEFGEKSPHHLQLNVPPLPFIGSSEAPVVLLLANPGYDVEHDKNWSKDKFINDGILANLHRKPDASLFFVSKEYRKLGDVSQWWKERTKELANAIGKEHSLSGTAEQQTERGFEDIEKKLLAIEYHPYHSKEWQPPFRTFESQTFTFDLVQKAMDREATIIIGRCVKHWYASVPDLRAYKHVIKFDSPRSTHISENNLNNNPNTFKKIVKKMIE